jgi:hypothetical protein
MPAFIKTPADEARWSKAKKAANKTLSESEGDSYWKLVNSIYQKMSKSEDVDLSKAYDDDDIRDELGQYVEDPSERERDDEDEYADQRREEPDYETVGEDDDEEKSDPAAEFLRQRESIKKPDQDAEEYSDEEDPAYHRRGIQEDIGEQSEPVDEDLEEPEEKFSSRFPQPTEDELHALHAYTRPWQDRIDKITAMRANHLENPIKAQHGHVVEAQAIHQKPLEDALKDFKSSDEFKRANPVERAKLLHKFKANWHVENKEHLKNAVLAHNEAHQRGEKERKEFEDKKRADLADVAGGKAAPSPYSLQEAVQHAGGVADDEGVQGVALQQDPNLRLMQANPEIAERIKRRMEEAPPKEEAWQDPENVVPGAFMSEEQIRAQKQGRAPVAQPKMQPTEVRPEDRDIKGLLGPAPDQDPKFNQFMGKYEPLKRRVLRMANKPGNDVYNQRAAEVINEAFTRGMARAVNTYDHNYAQKMGTGKQPHFSTHAQHQVMGVLKQLLSGMDEAKMARAEIKKEQKVAAAPKPKVEQPAAPPVAAPTEIKAQPAPAVEAPKPAQKTVVKRSGELLDATKHRGKSRMISMRAAVDAARAAQQVKAKLPQPEYGEQPVGEENGDN